MTSSAPSIITLVAAVVSLVNVIFAAFLFVRIKHGLFPVLQLKIELSELADDASGKPRMILIRLIAENKSDVYAKLRRGQSRLQILEHQATLLDETHALSEWVPFAEDRINEGEPPKQWAEPLQVVRTTDYIEAGESIRVDFLYRPSAPGVAVHCGFQVLTEPRKIPFLHDPTDSFTTTAWILTQIARAGA
jgi:hypothetical protein